jgi:metal-responsive CopG/Arc/MetJ family transcriptional regulator
MSRKARVTVTLSRDVLSKVDRAAHAKQGASRSSVIEAWLRTAAEHEARSLLDQAIVHYYDGLSSIERAENKEWARFSTQSFVVREGRAPVSSSRLQRRKPRKRR